MEFWGITLSGFELFSLLFAAILIGMSKTGIQGIATIAIPLMAIAFGAKESTGIILPMLCFADLIAIIYYRKSCEFKYILKLLPYTVVGFFVAIAIDKYVNAEMFKILMAFSIFIGLFFMIFGESTNAKLAKSKLYSPTFGILGGFSTMIGNAAGSIMAIYLLSMRLPKLVFIGTNAWFFMTINYLKLPLQIFAWDNITIESLKINVLAIAFIFVGAIMGIILVKRISEENFKRLIIALTLLSTLAMLF
ncbi:MAG: sulfite exporter TauE/SafE family protein [Opitutales bacterium]